MRVVKLILINLCQQNLKVKLRLDISELPYGVLCGRTIARFGETWRKLQVSTAKITNELSLKCCLRLSSTIYRV